MITDQELLDDYNTTGSAAAFAELMTRHRAHVHSGASRQTRGNTQLAEDVAQTVFCDLARKAGSIRGETLGAWLHGATCLAAKQAMRTEHRRMHRETEAFAANPLTSFDPSTEWDYTAASLGESLNRLRQEDRAAILLRFYEGRSLIEVGTALGTSEIAARKRIQRALKRLRSLLARQGVNTSAVALAGTLSAHAAQTVVIAPTLASSLSGLPAKTAAPRSAWASFKMLLAGKTKAASVAALLAAGAVAPLVLAQKPSAEAGPGIASTGEDRAQDFRDFLAKPPWIKKIIFRRSGNYDIVRIGKSRPKPLVEFAEFEAGIQPNGYYFRPLKNGDAYMVPGKETKSGDYEYSISNPEPGFEAVSGENAEYYWHMPMRAPRKPTGVRISPKNGPGASPNNREVFRFHWDRSRIDAMRRLGMDILAGGQFRWVDKDHFEADSTNGPAKGQITRYEQGLAAEIAYESGQPGSPRRFHVNYSYLKDLGKWLPSEFVATEIGGSGLIYTNYIDALDLGLDETKTNGYTPSDFPLVYSEAVAVLESSNGVVFVTRSGVTEKLDEPQQPPAWRAYQSESQHEKESRSTSIQNVGLWVVISSLCFISLSALQKTRSRKQKKTKQKTSSTL